MKVNVWKLDDHSIVKYRIEKEKVNSYAIKQGYAILPFGEYPWQYGWRANGSSMLMINPKGQTSG